MFEHCVLDGGSALHICENYDEFLEYENRLYGLYLQLYERGGVFYKGILVKMKRRPPDYAPKGSFYHLTCENYQHTQSEEDRQPNLRRYERIHWAKAIIEKCSEVCQDLLVWENTRGTDRNILLYCWNLKYLVVLSKRKDYLVLTTVYPVEHEHTHRKLMNEYSKYKQTTSSA